MADLLHGLIDFLLKTVGNLGYIGIILLMALESSFFPFPSEVVIPPAAYLASKGQFSLFGVIASGIFGSLLGAWFNYLIAYFLGRPAILKIGKLFGLKESKLLRVERFFAQHGEISTFIGRLLPVIRQYISFPAGLAEMNQFRFLLFTGIGAGIWVAILAYIGYLVGNNSRLIMRYSHKSVLVLSLFSCILVYIYVKWFSRKRPDKR